MALWTDSDTAGTLLLCSWDSSEEQSPMRASVTDLAGPMVSLNLRKFHTGSGGRELLLHPRHIVRTFR